MRIHADSKRCECLIEFVHVGGVVDNKHLVISIYLARNMDVMILIKHRVQLLPFFFQSQQSLMAQPVATLSSHIWTYELVLHNIFRSCSFAHNISHDLIAENDSAIHSLGQRPACHLAVEHRILVNGVDLCGGVLLMHKSVVRGPKWLWKVGRVDTRFHGG